MAGGTCGDNTSHYWLEDDGNQSMQLNVKKPPYAVPSMTQIREVKKNGYTVVSTFSGCGGSCLGFEMEGFTVLWASEFIPAARETYRHNHDGVILDDRDIRKVMPQDVLDATGLRKGELDVFEGSPPCASFSTAGKREDGWGQVKKYSDTKQRTDDLFDEYIRILDGLQPKVFIAENVSGLVKGVAKGYFISVLKSMKACGYRVEARLLDAQWLGVPQSRQRLIFIGTREDLPVRPAHPSPLRYRYSVRDAIPWIEGSKVIEDTGGEWGAGDVSERPVPTVRAAGVGQLVVEADISKYAIGAEWDKLKPGEQSEKYFNLVKPDPDEPLPTVTQFGGNLGAASVTHPFQRRKFTIAELKRVCGFPDDFVLTGTYTQQWERLGRAVPPVMMAKVAAVVRDEILNKLKGATHA